MLENNLFRIQALRFILAIDNEKNVISICKHIDSTYTFGYKMSKFLKKHELVTLKPFQLTKKGDELQDKLKRIYSLIHNGK